MASNDQNSQRTNPTTDRDDEPEGIPELFEDEAADYDEQEPENEDLFGDDMWRSVIWTLILLIFFCHFRDYSQNPELDVLSESGIDDATEFTEISAGARRAAEREMDERDNLILDEGQVVKMRSFSNHYLYLVDLRKR